MTAWVAVIACDKRKAFAQGSASDEAQSILSITVSWIASLALAMTGWLVLSSVI